MEQEAINRAYDAAAAAYAERCFHELDGKPLDRQLLERFAALTRERGRICDMGCGPGEVAAFLVPLHPDIIGIDASPGMVKQARALVPGATFMVGDMTALSLADGALAGIAAFYAIVNFPPEVLPCIFSGFFRVLRPGGLLLMAFHAGKERIHVDSFFECGEPLDFFYFDPDGVLEMLRQTGFTVREALVRHPYPEEYPSRRCYLFAEKE